MPPKHGSIKIGSNTLAIRSKPKVFTSWQFQTLRSIGNVGFTLLLEAMSGGLALIGMILIAAAGVLTAWREQVIKRNSIEI